MPTSRRRAIPRAADNSTGRRALPNSSATAGRPAESGPVAGPKRPEWTTERWKLQVEAEARGRLKKIIRNAGSKR
jgi:hypothetical protein